MSRSDLHDFTVYLWQTGKAAWLVDDGSCPEVWIPFSQGELVENKVVPGRRKTWTLTIPEWLAMEKGLL